MTPQGYLEKGKHRKAKVSGLAGPESALDTGTRNACQTLGLHLCVCLQGGSESPVLQATRGAGEPEP